MLNQTTTNATATPADFKEALRAFLTNDLLMGQDVTLKDDEDLLLSGLVDSLGVVRLTAFIESEFKLKVPPEDVVLENFQSLDAMAAYLRQRLGQAGS